MSNFYQNNKPKKHKSISSNFHLDNILKKLLCRQYYGGREMQNFLESKSNNKIAKIITKLQKL